MPVVHSLGGMVASLVVDAVDTVGSGGAEGDTSMKTSQFKAVHQFKIVHKAVQMKTMPAKRFDPAGSTTHACTELLYDALDLTQEASALAELSQIFARRGLALMAEHALQKASGRLAYASALLDLADEVAGPGAQTTLAIAP